jgi:integrase
VLEGSRLKPEKLTDTFCKQVKPPKTGQIIYWDAGIEGFGLRLTANNHRSFILNYRIQRKQRRYTIGKFPDQLSATTARGKAQRLSQGIREGHDPFIEKQRFAQETIEEQARARTVRDLANAYMENHVRPKRRAKTIKEYQAQIDNHILPQLSSFRVGSVLPRDINDRIHVPLRATPYLANRVLSLIAAMFNWAKTHDAEGWGLGDRSNPAEAIERYEEQKRVSWLTEDEMQRLSKALDGFPAQVREDLDCSEKQKRFLVKEAKRIVSAVRLLFFTGSRAKEVLGATWSEFDLERKRWDRPAQRNKQKRAESVPLSDEAVAILKALPHDNEFVFPGRHPGESLTDISGAWQKIRDVAGLPDLRLHDLRHNYATWLVSSGESLTQVGRLLGHSQPATTQRYVAFQDKPLREATNRFAAIAARRTDARTPARR